MAAGRRYTAFRKALAELKLKQLDIYRYPGYEVLRVLTPDGKVVQIKLPKRRDEMTVDEFKKYVAEALAAGS